MTDLKPCEHRRLFYTNPLTCMDCGQELRDRSAEIAPDAKVVEVPVELLVEAADDINSLWFHLYGCSRGSETAEKLRAYATSKGKA